MQLLNIIFPFRDWFYLLQLEEYDSRRYKKHIFKRFLRSHFEKRDTLKFTTRIKVQLALVVAGVALSLWYLSTISWSFVLAAVLLLPVLTPYIILASNRIVSPFVWLAATLLIRKAKLHWHTQNPNTKIIAITGSFGKTTTKYRLQSYLEHTFNVAIIPDNINTTLGVAQYLLLNRIPKQCEYLIVEMGAYEIGDIATTAKLLQPDIAIITALGDQHLERFGSVENLIFGKYELFAYAKSDAALYTTTVAKALIEREALPSDEIIALNVTGLDTNRSLARKVASDLSVSTSLLDEADRIFTPPGRRDERYEINGVTIIDNSYNISPMTATALIEKAAATATELNKKLIVMTGGIGEQGQYAQAANTEFAKLLNQTAARVLLNPTEFIKDITPNLTIPHEVIEHNVTVLKEPQRYLDPETDLLLYLTGHTDLAYFN